MVIRTIVRAGISYAKKKACQKKYRQEVKSLDKYNVHAAIKKGAVPLKKQSSIKSTLSGRQYSISNNKLSPKTILDLGVVVYDGLRRLLLLRVSTAVRCLRRCW